MYDPARDRNKQCVSLIAHTQLVLWLPPTVQRHQLYGWLSLCIGPVHVKLVTCPKCDSALSRESLQTQAIRQPESRMSRDRECISRQTVTDYWCAWLQMLYHKCSLPVLSVFSWFIVGVWKCQVLFPRTSNNCVIVMCHTPVSSWQISKRKAPT